MVSPIVYAHHGSDDKIQPLRRRHESFAVSSRWMMVALLEAGRFLYRTVHFLDLRKLHALHILVLVLNTGRVPVGSNIWTEKRT